MCQQSVALFTAVQSIAMLPINIAGMCVIFIQANKMFNPSYIAAKKRHMNRVKRLTGGK
jgi:hypothetical protein